MGSNATKKMLVKAQTELIKAGTVIFRCKISVNAELVKIAAREREEERAQKNQEALRRKQKVVLMRKSGLTYKNIASELNMSPHLVGRLCRKAA